MRAIAALFIVYLGSLLLWLWRQSPRLCIIALAVIVIRHHSAVIFALAVIAFILERRLSYLVKIVSGRG